MRIKSKKFAACIVALTMIITSFGVTAFAADTTETGTGSVTGTIAINGTISPLTISVTHPITAAYAINPNGGSTTSLTAPDITVTNNTKAPVNVTVESLSAAAGGTLTFTDVDSSTKSWASLSLAESKKYISMGIKAKASTGWNTGYNTAMFNSVDTSPMVVGTLNSAATGTMTLTANHGLAFDSNYTADHNLVFKFELA